MPRQIAQKSGSSSGACGTGAPCPTTRHRGKSAFIHASRKGPGIGSSGSQHTKMVNSSTKAAAVSHSKT